MSKYYIEGGNNFYDELYKSLHENDEEDDEKETVLNSNKCLITNLELCDKYIELNCGHKFNYVPLYSDLVHHKQKFNVLERSKTRLRLNEIRCPYCRMKQEGVLPYYEELGLDKINGVNYYDPNAVIEHAPITTLCKCEFQYINEQFDPTQPETSANCKYHKYVSCQNWGAKPILLYNSENPSEPITFDDNKLYCKTHLKHMISSYKAEKKQKQKEAKQLEKEAKRKERKSNSKSKSVIENVVLGPVIISAEIVTCVQILKTGPNKGQLCGCKVSGQGNLCKRHNK
jgi:hypothetical protein